MSIKQIFMDFHDSECRQQCATCLSYKDCPDLNKAVSAMLDEMPKAVLLQEGWFLAYFLDKDGRFNMMEINEKNRDNSICGTNTVFINSLYCRFCPHCLISRLWFFLVRKSRNSKRIMQTHFRYDKANTQQLDSISDNTNNSILSDNPSVDRGCGGALGSKEGEETREEGIYNQINERPIGNSGVNNMSEHILEHGDLLQIPFEVNKKREKIEYKVEASNPIKFYLVDEENYLIFKEGHRFRPYNDIVTGKYFYEKIILEQGRYYLLFYSKDPKPIAVHHELYYYY